ncbi:MAG: sugar ABC transporter substrate-binding protein [Solirubrobacteraceae bacterium]
MRKFFTQRSGIGVAPGVIGALLLALVVAFAGSTSAAASSRRHHAKKAPAHLKIAYLSFAVDNSYDAPMLAAAQATAAANHATVKVFDAANNPATQYAQFQDAIAAGGYNGIITQPIESTNLIPLIKKAAKKGIKVVNIDQVMGPKLNTAKIQVKGLAGDFAQVPTQVGHALGVLTVRACASKHLNPCDIGYLYDIKASTLDNALQSGFDAAIKGHNIKILATGQDFFTPSGGLTAVENMMSAAPNIEVISGTDQGLEGAQEDTSLPKSVVLVGYGGSAAGDAGVKAGRWYGTWSELPAKEGRIGMQTLVNAIRNHKDYPGVNSYAHQYDGGFVTKADLKHFTAQWPG